MKTFTIISSKEQKKYVIDTEATTMAELTAAMDAAGIDYKGSTLYEGLTKSEFNPEKADAILPHDVPYKGNVTSDLVFMLTVPQKKITSGSDMSYAEMRTYIKDNNLADDFKNAYGKSYTQGSTKEFEKFISAQKYLEITKPIYCEEETDPIKELLVDIRTASTNLTSKIDALMVMLGEQKEYIDDADFDERDSPFSSDEINDMFADM